MLPHHSLPPHHGRMRMTPASAAMVSSARSRDPRLSKMRQPSATKVGSMITPSFPMVPPTNSIRTLPRIPKYNKSSSSSTSRDDREERDPRKRRDRDEKLSSKSGESRGKSSSSSSLKSSPTSKKLHDSPRKRSEEEKRNSKSSQKSSSSRSHSSSKSPNNGYKSPSELKDVDLRIITETNAEDATLPMSMDVDMRPDSTTTPAAAAANTSKLNKNKLLNELLQDEDRSSQDSLISTSYDNGKEQKINLMMTMKMSLIFVS